MCEKMIQVVSVTKEKGPGYTIKLSSGESFLISEDLLVRHRLLKGQEISDEMVATIQKEGHQDLGYQMSLNYLSYQLRTEKEMRDYLKEKEINSVDIPPIIAKLKEMQLVNDLTYSESYVRTQMRLSDKGPTVLQQNLLKKGVKIDVIEKALALYTEEKQLEIAGKLAEKTAKKNHSKTFTIKKQKVQQTLMTKGFSSDVAKAIMSELALEKDVDKEADLIMTEGDKFWRKNARYDAYQRKQKTMQGLMRKGFDYETIKHYLSEKELEDE